MNARAQKVTDMIKPKNRFSEKNAAGMPDGKPSASAGYTRKTRLTSQFQII